MITDLDPTTLSLRRMIPASVERVFDAWMVREEWEAWLGPPGITCTVPVFEPTVGGHYEVLMHMPGGEQMTTYGTFRAIEPPSRLVFTWGVQDPERQSLVTLTFKDIDGETELVLIQEGLGTVENRDAHEQGWSGALGKLVAYVQR